MPTDNNKLELVVEVDVDKANASIKSVNTGLSGSSGLQRHGHVHLKDAAS